VSTPPNVVMGYPIASQDRGAPKESHHSPVTPPTSQTQQQQQQVRTFFAFLYGHLINVESMLLHPLCSYFIQIFSERGILWNIVSFAEVQNLLCTEMFSLFILSQKCCSTTSEFLNLH
jgi:hypothetical protein